MLLFFLFFFAQSKDSREGTTKARPSNMIKQRVLMRVGVGEGVGET